MSEMHALTEAGTVASFKKKLDYLTYNCGFITDKIKAM